VQLAIECNVPDGTSITAYENIVLRSGALSTRTIENLKKAVGISADIDTWTGGDWPPFQIVVDDEEWNGEMRRKVIWINPNNSGGTGVSQDPDAVSRFKAQHGAKLRALLGGTPANTPKPPAAPKRERPARTATMEECWEVFCEQNDGKEEHDLYNLWDKLVADIAGKDQGDMTGADWGKIAQRLED